MSARVIYTIPLADLHAATDAAKEQARREGHRVRTIARISPDASGYRVELVVDERPMDDVAGSLPADQGGGADTVIPGAPSRSTPQGSWVREAREDAIAWRRNHVAKGGA